MIKLIIRSLCYACLALGAMTGIIVFGKLIMSLVEESLGMMLFTTFLALAMLICLIALGLLSIAIIEATIGKKPEEKNVYLKWFSKTFEL